MKNIIRILTLALVLVGVPAVTTPMTGCAVFDTQATPADRYAELNELFIFGVRNAISARQNGHISDEAWADTYLPAINAGNEALEQMDAARKSGDLTAFNAARIVLNQAIEQIGGQ
jgi:hypothetical protein